MGLELLPSGLQSPVEFVWVGGDGSRFEWYVLFASDDSFLYTVSQVFHSSILGPKIRG